MGGYSIGRIYHTVISWHFVFFIYTVVSATALSSFCALCDLDWVTLRPAVELGQWSIR